MADNSCDILLEKPSNQETEEAKVVCPSDTVLKLSDLYTAQSVGLPSSSIVQEIFFHQPVEDVNFKSLDEFDKGFLQDQVFVGVKNLSINEMPNIMHSSGLKIEVIDDTALIETGIVHGFEEDFVGFAHYTGKSCWKKMRKQESHGKNVDSWRKMGKGSRNCSRATGNGKGSIHLVENGNLYEQKGDGNRKVEKTKKMAHYESRKCSRNHGNGKALTRKIDGQNECFKSYTKKGMEERQSSESVEEVQLKKKTDVYHELPNCSRTNGIKIPLKRAETGPVVFISEKDQEQTENVCEKKCDGSKRVYTRKEMEALRFIGVVEQRKMWAEVYYCGLSPAAMRDFKGLVDTSRKYIHVNVDPMDSVIGSSSGAKNEEAKQVPVSA